MQLFLILIASILSALICDLLSIIRTINRVIGISKESLEVMKSPDLDDDRKQTILLSISGKMFLYSIKLAGLLLAICFPFFAIHITEILANGTTSFSENLGTVAGIGLSLSGFLLYFGAKKIYARF